MTVERIAHNLYYIPGHGQVVVPTGIACHASQGYWRISYKIYPDIPGDERYFRFHWYSDVYHALMDAIGTLEFYAEDMRIGHKVAEEPRRNKMTTLPAGCSCTVTTIVRWLWLQIHTAGLEYRKLFQLISTIPP